MTAAAPVIAPARLGPGRLVLVVGPSGAGKDTLIGEARAALGGAGSFVFPQRLVTRPPSASEDNLEVATDDFERLKAGGAFALSWEAHGHCYGIPAAIDADIAAGRHVIVNVSRSVVQEARARYAAVRLVEVQASPEMLAARLGARARASDGDAARRLSRPAPDVGTGPDAVVRNDGALAEAVAAFLAAVTAPD